MSKDLRTSCITYVLASLVIICASVFLALPAAATGYFQTNLVSDIPGLAKFTDPNLKNPWGITHSATSPFWVSDNGSGKSTLYNGAGQPFPVGSPLVVTIPPPPGSLPGSLGAPTGVVFNPVSGSGAFTGNLFLFATEGGTINGWRGALGTTAETNVITTDAVYKGLALGNNGSGNFLYATNFTGGKIDVFDSSFNPATLPGSFTDPTLPAGYAPFNVQNIGGSLFVTYAVASGDEDVPGPGNGIVDVFDLNGNLERRFFSGGVLNSPWGLAEAPANFGEFSNDLLVGNFGDGTINAFKRDTGEFLGTLKDSLGNDIINEGLWGLIFGNGGNGGDPNTLYFTAGLDEETHGLFGSLAVPVPSTVVLLGSGLAGLLTFARARRRRV
jgi:uncharacterized protein (TIGR03118 family)